MASRNVAACGTLVKRLMLLGVLSLCSALPTWGQVTFTQGPEQIAVAIEGKPFTVFYISGRDLNRPYLHPLRSASGRIVNRSFPAGQLPGETTDHPHHAGLFYGHGDVNGYNYWAIENVPTARSSANTTMGRIVLKDVLSVKSGKESGTVDVVFNWLKPDGTPLVIETRKMTFYAHPDLRIIDFDFDFSAIGKVVFRDTKEGTFAMRLATALEEPSVQNQGKAAVPSRTGKLMNAQGAEREANVWGRRSEWVDYSGTLDGEPVGVVMMDHPDNPGHPTYWHSRGYGLHSINPYGVSDFLNDKAHDGSLTLEPGQHVRFRYRVIIHAGASRASLATMYSQYARRQ
jgi:methane monooxygenase PmoA-like